MTSEQIQAIVLALIALVSGAFGRDLIRRWSERDQQAADQAGARTQRSFADNEQARMWLRGQLDERDDELKRVRENETELLKEVGVLRALVAKLEERTNAQSARIDDLSALVARVGGDYAEMKAERDAYRDAKHDAENRLTPAIIGRQMVERELDIARNEIERLHGHIEAISNREDHGRPGLADAPPETA